MSESHTDEIHPVIRESHDRLPIVAGAVTTLVATAVFFVIPALIAVSELRQVAFELSGDVITGNPLLNLRLFGGLAGGFVAGYTTGSRWVLNARNGVLAVVYGLLTLYVLFAAYNVVNAALAGVFPPPIFVIAVVPAVYLLPLLAVFLVSGFVGGVSGGFVASE